MAIVIFAVRYLDYLRPQPKRDEVFDALVLRLASRVTPAAHKSSRSTTATMAACDVSARVATPTCCWRARARGPRNSAGETSTPPIRRRKRKPSELRTVDTVGALFD